VRDPARPGPAPRRSAAGRGKTARLASASAISTPPDQALDQYIGWAIGNFSSSTNGEMISQAPSSRLPNCSPGNPRGLASAAAPTATAASPAITSVMVALAPLCCSTMNQGEMATHSPVSIPSAAATWALTPRQPAGSRYSAATAGRAGLAGTAWGGAPPDSGRRVSGEVMTSFFRSAGYNCRAVSLVASQAGAGAGPPRIPCRAA